MERIYKPTPLLGLIALPTGETYLRVCSWCAPGFNIFKDYPEQAGQGLTHGACQFHKNEFLSKISAARRQAARN